jgi:hypothetical protein
MDRWARRWPLDWTVGPKLGQISAAPQTKCAPGRADTGPLCVGSAAGAAKTAGRKTRALAGAKRVLTPTLTPAISDQPQI